MHSATCEAQFMRILGCTWPGSGTRWEHFWEVLVVEFEPKIQVGQYKITSGRGGQPRMGWRKLTVPDRDDGSGALRRGSATHHLRGPASLEDCFDAAASSLVGRVGRPQSGPRMWSSTVQRSPRVRCRTALSQLPGMASRPMRSQTYPPAGIVRVDCATAIISINQISSATGIARGSYGMTIAQLEVRE